MSLVSLPANSDVQARCLAGSRGRILIVDDEEVIAATLKEFLQGEGYEAATALDMPSALAQVESFEPDVVLCDVQLPGGDGSTLLNRVAPDPSRNAVHHDHGLRDGRERRRGIPARGSRLPDEAGDVRGACSPRSTGS